VIQRGTRTDTPHAGDAELTALRVEVDGVDTAIVNLLARRAEIIRRTANLNRARGLPPDQTIPANRQPLQEVYHVPLRLGPAKHRDRAPRRADQRAAVQSHRTYSEVP
jgi:chorismate mutase